MEHNPNFEMTEQGGKLCYDLEGKGIYGSQEPGLYWTLQTLDIFPVRHRAPKGTQ
jgi:hypothetical protein